MSREVVIILSGTTYNLGIMQSLRAAGIVVVVVDWRARPDLIGDLTIRSDVTDFSGIAKQLEEARVGKVIGAYTSSDIAVSTMNRLNAYFCGRSVKDSILRDILSKTTMAERWRTAGLFNRISKPYKRFETEIFKFNEQHKTLIKPDNSSSSRGVSILSRGTAPRELLSAFQHAARYASNGIVLVEEFIEGREYTVEMIGDDKGNVGVYAVSLKYHTQNTTNNKIAVKLHYNADVVPDDKQSRIAEFAAACYRSFGLRCSMGHLEVLERADGSLVPVEMNSRSAGYIACPLVDVVSRRNFFMDYLAVLRGTPIEDMFHRSANSSVYYFYDLPSGRVSRTDTNLTEYLDSRIMSLYHDRSRVRANESYDLIACDNDRVGYEILAGPRAVLTAKHLMGAEERFLECFFGATVPTR